MKYRLVILFTLLLKLATISVFSQDNLSESYKKIFTIIEKNVDGYIIPPVFSSLNFIKSDEVYLHGTVFIHKETPSAHSYDILYDIEGRIVAGPYQLIEAFSYGDYFVSSDGTAYGFPLFFHSYTDPQNRSELPSGIKHVTDIVLEYCVVEHGLHSFDAVQPQYYRIYNLEESRYVSEDIFLSVSVVSNGESDDLFFLVQNETEQWNSQISVDTSSLQ